MSQSSRYFPQQGRSKDSLLQEMKALKEKDMNWQDGRIFSLVFSAGDEVLELLKEAHALFMSENGLNPGAFPSLRKFETEVLAMAAELLHGDAEVVGNMTSGGTESILMAVKTAREQALSLRPEIKNPEIVLPVTAHPAFDKACHYFGLSAVHIPVKADFRADLEAYRRAIGPNTVLCVGSAPSYPQGVVDPIAEMAAIAQEKGLLFHVDACVGGFMLPFVRKLGYAVPDFDFAVPGVTSISADLHKYAYAAKGASVVLYRNAALRRHQFFVYTDWPGGIYPSPTMVGTRPGGSIAAAWAVMKHLGEEGYLRIAREVMNTTRHMIDVIRAMDDLTVLSHPEMSIFAIGSDSLDIYAVGDEMSVLGWHMDRQQSPPSLHVTVNFAHVQSQDRFLQDLEQAVAKARKLSWNKVSSKFSVGLVKGLSKVLPEKLFSRLVTASNSSGPKGGQVPKRTAAMYGMIGSLPNRGDVEEMVLDFMDQTYRVERDPG
ncbi:MAG: pyridoxal phosphate-dependent decarboxylase family protein [Candidatus Sericytochromatia bacterium]